MPDLTRDQQAALDALGWLLSTSPTLRGQGRTTALAIALIRHALAHPGLAVSVSEPGLPIRNDVLPRVIAQLVDTDPRLADHLQRDLLSGRTRQSILRFEGLTGPVQGAATWLPRGWRRALRPLANIPNLSDQELADLIDENQIIDPTAPGPSEVETFDSWIAQRLTRPRAPTARPAEPPSPQSLWQHLKDD